MHVVKKSLISPITQGMILEKDEPFVWIEA